MEESMGVTQYVDYITSPAGVQRHDELMKTCRSFAKHPNPAQLAEWEQLEEPSAGNPDSAVAADLAASFLTGFIGGMAGGAIRIPHAAPAVGFARPLVVAPRAPSVAHTSPRYIPPRTAVGQTAVKPATAVTQTAKPATTSSGTTTSGSSAASQRQGCAGLRASMNQSAVFYQENPSQYQTALARYNSLCGN